MPTSFALNLEAGKARADRDRLLRLVFAMEDGLETGSAPESWRLLLHVAHWMRAQDEEAPDGTR